MTYTQDRFFSDDQSTDELIDSIVRDLENDYGEINWRKAKSVMQYITEAVEADEDAGEIYENAMHQLEELDLD